MRADPFQSLFCSSNGTLKSVQSLIRSTICKCKAPKAASATASTAQASRNAAGVLVQMNWLLCRRYWLATRTGDVGLGQSF
jgi:hypothetical protein